MYNRSQGHIKSIDVRKIRCFNSYIYKYIYIYIYIIIIYIIYIHNYYIYYIYNIYIAITILPKAIATFHKLILEGLYI